MPQHARQRLRRADCGTAAVAQQRRRWQLWRPPLLLAAHAPGDADAAQQPTSLQHALAATAARAASAATAAAAPAAVAAASTRHRLCWPATLLLLLWMWLPCALLQLPAVAATCTTAAHAAHQAAKLLWRHLLQLQLPLPLLLCRHKLPLLLLMLLHQLLLPPHLCRPISTKAHRRHSNGRQSTAAHAGKASTTAATSCCCRSCHNAGTATSAAADRCCRPAGGLAPALLLQLRQHLLCWLLPQLGQQLSRLLQERWRHTQLLHNPVTPRKQGRGADCRSVQLPVACKPA